MKKLSVWAKENGVAYPTAYNWYKNNKLPVQASKNAGGSIMVVEADVKQNSPQGPQIVETPVITPIALDFGASMKQVLGSEDTSVRRNASSTNIRTDAYKNINDGISPFQYGVAGNSTNITVRDAIVLCQKAYYNFSMYRNVIDLMTELSVGDIHFKGGSKKSQEFFNALWNKNNIINLQDRYYREYYRSANVFIFRLDGLVNTEDFSTLQLALGSELKECVAKTIKLPVKYIILNPADVEVGGNILFSKNMYFKALNAFEIARLKAPVTDEERELAAGLPPEVKAQLGTHNQQGLLMPLDQDKLTVSFYKKQDYEPMAIPLGFPVMEDINAKSELKKMDMAVARTMQQVILLIKVGSELKDGTVNKSKAS
jgi:hypothetical protein